MSRLREYLSRPDVAERPATLLARRAQLEALRRWHPTGFHRTRTFDLNDGARMTARLSDNVGGALFSFGGFEPDLTARLRALLRPGDLFLDIGAHIGTFTVLAGRAGANVVAFEPTAANRELLRRNVSQNGLDGHVAICPVALLDHDDELTIGTPEADNSGMSRLGVGTEVVPCRRLDDLLPDLAAQPVRVVKIDVEGFEEQALRGGEQTIRRDRPDVLFEANEFAAVELLRGWGYRVTDLDGHREVNGPDDLRGLNRAGVALNLWARP